MDARDPEPPARAAGEGDVDLVLIIIAYGPTLVRLLATTPLTTPGLRVW